jgi:pyruvate dehydrogenase E2 component (dihydrolipoamide acetyltransferase)
VTVEFRLPDLGEGIHEAEVLAWKVQPGDRVEAFQPVVEVESAKAAVELTSPATGRVASIAVPAGATAHLGDLLFVIEPDLSPAGQSAGPSAATPVDAEPEFVGIVGSAPRTREAPAAESGRVLAAPFVRKLARDRGIRLEDVPGTGPHGRVRLSDLDVFAEGSPAAQAKSSDVDIIPFAGLRKRIADHMVEAVRSAPQVTAMDLFDVTELVDARAALRPVAETEGAHLTYLPFLIKACLIALRAVPDANGVVDEASHALVRHRACHIGIATAVPGGLIVPVIRHAEQRSMLDLAREIERLAGAARARHTPRAELEGGTFTITSFGGFDGSPLFATPILNHPQVAILGVGRIDPQPRVVDGAIAIRQCMGVSFTFDHRVLDGEAAARFLAALRAPLEHPLQLLLRV